jgi:hypothetical protein
MKTLYMGTGDIVQVGDIYLKLTRLKNSLCPSVYDPSVRCFWEGQLTGSFKFTDEKENTLSEFHLSTHARGKETGLSKYGYIYSHGEIKHAVRATGRYDPGTRSEEATMEIVIEEY